MRTRLATEADRYPLISLGRQLSTEQTPHLVYDEVRAYKTIDRHFTDPTITFFVVEDGDEIVGFLMALRIEYVAHAGFFIGQELFYVRPDKRGTRAAASLFTAFNAWADSLNPEEVFAGIATGHRPEVASRWMRRFGFEPVGPTMRRLVGSANHVLQGWRR